MIKPNTWILWVITAIIIASITRNPFYQILLFLCLNILLEITKPQNYVPPISVHKFGAVILVFSTLFNFVTSHFGSTVFFLLPDKLPLIGGAYTLEALVYGAINGLALVNMLITFNVLNQVITTKQLINLIPRSFFPLTLVLTISLTLIPSTRRQFDQVREAQSIRGHQMKNLRDWLPLFLPLLIGGMEHAYQLAETMTARGFTQPMRGKFTTQRIGILSGFVLLIAGWLVSFFSTSNVSSISFMVTGGMILMGSFLTINQSMRIKQANIIKISTGDIVTLVSILTIYLIQFAKIPGIDLATLTYNPYPTIATPGFDPWVGISLVLFLVPGLILLRAANDDPAN